MNREELITEIRAAAVKGGLVCAAIIAVGVAALVVFSVLRIIMHWCYLLMLSFGLAESSASGTINFFGFLLLIGVVVGSASAGYFWDEANKRREKGGDDRRRE